MNWVGRYQGVVPVPVPVYRDPLPWLNRLPARAPIRRQRAAIAYVNGSTSTGSGTSLVINVPGSVSNGHFMLLVLAHQGQTAHAITGGGWAFLYSNTNLVGWYRIASSEPASYTITWTGSAGAVGASISAWSGQDTDPILAFRGRQGTEPTPHPASPDLYFQACDYTVISALAHGGGGAVTIPSGWSAGPNSGGGARSAQAYTTFTNTQGYSSSGHNWTDTGGNHSPAVLMLALRESGNTALALKSTAVTPFGGGTSFACSLPPGYAAGDLLVVHHVARDANPNTARTLSASGYTVHGTQQNYVSGTLIFASVMYKRIATGSDALTCASTLSCDTQKALVMAFSTGGSGPDPSLPGTMGQQVDSGVDTTHNVSAMTLDDYAENNILVAIGSVNAGGASTLVPPSGFEAVLTDLTNSISSMAAVKMNGAANPGATSFASSGTSAASQTYQLAVGSVLVGAGASETQQGYVM